MKTRKLKTVKLNKQAFNKLCSKSTCVSIFSFHYFKNFRLVSTMCLDNLKHLGLLIKNVLIETASSVSSYVSSSGIEFMFFL